MSDGMSDANAIGRLALNLEAAASELGEAIRKAKEGRRGLEICIADTVNDFLKGTGYRLQPYIDPGESP